MDIKIVFIKKGVDVAIWSNPNENIDKLCICSVICIYTITAEMVHQFEEMDFDVIIMSSSRLSSYVRVLGSTVRKVVDSLRKPVLLINE